MTAGIHAYSVEAPTHGRYLVRASSGRQAALLVSFHGYKENAEIQMKRLASVEGADRCLLVSVQGLSRFYRRGTDEVIASWMTRQDRDQAIADNLVYIRRVLEQVSVESQSSGPLIFAGFSQGVAMAFRAACDADRPAHVIAIGGDVPPELDRERLARLGRVLLGRGARDTWYTNEKWEADQARLRDADVATESLLLDAGHEWTAESNPLIAGFLRTVTD